MHLHLYALPPPRIEFLAKNFLLRGSARKCLSVCGSTKAEKWKHFIATVNYGFMGMKNTIIASCASFSIGLLLEVYCRG